MESGNHRFGPETGRLLLKTSRTGLGRRAGHDLTIEMTRWSAEAVLDLAEPANSSLSVEVEVGSLEPLEGTGGIKPLTDSDRAEIKKTATQQILRVAEFPTITFQSTSVAGTPQSFTITGNLTIMGQTRPVTVSGAADGEVRGHATVVQSEWGITPYSAFLGALKLADEVKIEFSATSP